VPLPSEAAFFIVRVDVAFQDRPIITLGSTGRLSPIEQHESLAGFLQSGGHEHVA